MLFGEYEVDFPPEWKMLVSSLMAVQLGSLKKLMRRLKNLAEEARFQPVSRNSVETKWVMDLNKRLRASLEGLWCGYALARPKTLV